MFESEHFRALLQCELASGASIRSAAHNSNTSTLDSLWLTKSTCTCRLPSRSYYHPRGSQTMLAVLSQSTTSQPSVEAIRVMQDENYVLQSLGGG